MLRQSDLFARVKALGMGIIVLDGEYRVSFTLASYMALGLGKQEAFARLIAEAYYTDDRDDAYGTAIIMAKRGPSL